MDNRHLDRRPVRVAARGRNALSPRLRLGMDIRHMTFEQYRYFRDVGLGGQLPDAQVNRSFRGSAPHRGRAGAALALGTGSRWREWATVLLPELGIGPDVARSAAEFTVQACAKYGKARPIYVPEDAIDSVDTYCLLERPELARAAARTLARKHRDLFVVKRIDYADRRVRGTLQGVEREYAISGDAGPLAPHHRSRGRVRAGSAGGLHLPRRADARSRLLEALPARGLAPHGRPR
ncbi:hypothetical protein ABZ079_36555 [Streptomyces sp. NPDC006314]|uniref:hypothetical protein n=1 Tax=Streptomyces sp. NPDC006314 TaxID=3154475 RepID=UPI0033A1952F